MVTAAVRDTVDTNGSTEGLANLLQGDFTGPDNFIYWLVAIMIIGAIGYVPKMKGISNAFLVLIIVVLFITRGNPKMQGGGFFKQFTSAINSTAGGAKQNG